MRLFVYLYLCTQTLIYTRICVYKHYLTEVERLRICKSGGPISFNLVFFLYATSVNSYACRTVHETCCKATKLKMF